VAGGSSYAVPIGVSSERFDASMLTPLIFDPNQSDLDVIARLRRLLPLTDQVGLIELSDA